MTFEGTAMSENHNLWHANDGLITGEHSAAVLHPLDNVIHALEMLPYESANFWVFGNSLKFVVWKDIGNPVYEDMSGNTNSHGMNRT
jgi:hypothetical protein